MANLKKLSKKRLSRKSASLDGSVAAECFLTQKISTFLHKNFKKDLNINRHLLVALSGGLDSIMLLHLLVKVSAEQAFPFKVYAMHVHHGLSNNADYWADFCTEQCKLLNVPLQIARVNIEKISHLGIEGAARQLRYEALFNAKLDIDNVTKVIPDYVVTAHHQDDQAETLLLQLFRGAGIKGLASMTAIDASRRLMRPLLDVPRKALEDYAELHHIQWCEDESNQNTQYERNFLRHEVLPLLEMRHPSIKSALARTASHLAEANDLLESLAAIDAEYLLKANSICLEGLNRLTHSRVKNLLRCWFSKNNLMMPSSDHLTEIIQQLFNAKPDAGISIQLQLHDQAQYLLLKRFQKRVYLYNEQDKTEFALTWNGEAELTLPNGGRLSFMEVIGTGLAVKFGINKLRITNREGAERFKPDALRPTRTLKYLFQEAQIPPWQRVNLPLIYWQDTLAYVPGIGIAHDLKAKGQELGIEVIWHEDSL